MIWRVYLDLISFCEIPEGSVELLIAVGELEVAASIKAYMENDLRLAPAGGNSNHVTPVQQPRSDSLRTMKFQGSQFDRCRFSRTVGVVKIQLKCIDLR